MIIVTCAITLTLSGFFLGIIIGQNWLPTAAKEVKNILKRIDGDPSK